MSVFVVVADTDPEGPSQVVAAAATMAAARVIEARVPNGRIEQVDLAENTLDAWPIVREWRRLNPY